MSSPRIFSIPPGVAFLRRLAESLCDGTLIEDFRYEPADPLVLSEATIHVPTRRAARALRSEFVDLLGGGTAVLPTIRALGDGEDDADYLDERQPALLELAPPVGATQRILELAQLIVAWKRNLPAAIASFHGENRLIAPASPADAVWLARSLAELLDSVDTEACDWAALDGLVAADHAAWWQLTLEFLRIATAFWPARLAELQVSNPAAHRNAVLHAETQRLRSAPPAGPVVVAGSTGSIPATAALMAAVAGLERGAIVLPGLDHHMAEPVWHQVGGDPEAEHFDPAVCAHPQYGFFRLLPKLGAVRSEVRSLAQADPAIERRNRLVSTALMPAEATALWAEMPMGGHDILPAFEHVELIEAGNEREEALAIAAAMRMAAEIGIGPPLDPPRTVALVTPDRALARRVAAELRRFGIDADDSGGIPLARTPPGGLLELVLQAAFGAQPVVALLALLKHPLARFGRTADRTRRAARLIERVALRGGNGEARISALSDLFDRRLAERQAEQRHAPQWLKRLTDSDVARARALASDVDRAFAPLLEVSVKSVGTVRQWADRSARVLEAIARDERGSLASLWQAEAGEKLASLLGAVMEDQSGFSCTAAEWAAMTPALFGGEMVKPRAGRHPHIFIWGALEARLQRVDTLVLAGLNEGTWPGSVSSDPFLSRSMKAQIGLDPPERRIGLAAHDIQMGLGAPHVILSRSARVENAPAVASRWLQRLIAVIGSAQAENMRARGRRYLQWAEALDRRPDTPMVSRPAPRPPAPKQPVRYSFSEVRTLRRDPYAIYARRILRLDPPEPLIGAPGPAERGTLYHRILECFVRETTEMRTPDAGTRLAAIAAREFAAAGLPDAVALVWRHQFDRVAPAFLAWERNRDDHIAARHTELRARHQMPGGPMVSGIADRIDLRHDGTAEIIDYKTGLSPSRKVAWILLDPQLALEAAALQAGAFEGLGPLLPASLAYVRLRPGDRFRTDVIEGDLGDGDKSAVDLANEAADRLSDLVAALASGRLGFASQIVPDSGAIFGRDYDHLARLGEWSSAEADVVDDS